VGKAVSKRRVDGQRKKDPEGPGTKNRRERKNPWEKKNPTEKLALTLNREGGDGVLRFPKRKGKKELLRKAIVTRVGG